MIESYLAIPPIIGILGLLVALGIYLVVTNFPPKQIGPFISECLITGFHRQDNKVVLAIPEQDIENGVVLA